MKVKNKLCNSVLIYLFIITNLVVAQNNQTKSIFDGPHIFYSNDSLTIKYYANDIAKTYRIEKNDTTIFRGFLQDSAETYVIPQQFKSHSDIYSNAGKIFVVSDIHGKYDIFKDLLRNNNIIDQNNSWIWGNGHLVILGDVFDKGSYVHECLWLIYKLEQQAEAHGGRVHFLLGNHEVKALRGDLKYVKENYFTIAQSFAIPIPELYFENTFFGRWLRSKNVLTQIDSLLFVHGGIHPELINKYSSISDINKIMKDNLDLSLEEIKRDSSLSFLFRKNGPIRYRGFFISDSLIEFSDRYLKDNLDLSLEEIKRDSSLSFLFGKNGSIRYRGFFIPDSLLEFSDQHLNDILNHFNVEKIIVGHTTGERVYTRNNNRILCVDGGISKGREGEGLLIRNNIYYRADINGQIQPLF